MNGTVLENPLIREYLKNLDAACARLRVPSARELREQVIAHLDEALSPGAAADEVKAELDRLGSPRALAAEAAGPRSAARRLLTWLFRIRWWAWTLIATGVTFVIAAAVFLSLMESAQPLDQGGLAAWWFYADGSRAVHADVGVSSIWAAPERYRQEQGFIVGIYNESDWTQTIVAGYPDVQPGDLSARLAVAGGPYVEHTGQWNDQTRWDLPASIPPHSYRLLRVLWVSYMCTQPGNETTIADLVLQVRVGLITRTEDLPLHTTAFALSGTKASASACGL